MSTEIEDWKDVQVKVEVEDAEEDEEESPVPPKKKKRTRRRGGCTKNTRGYRERHRDYQRQRRANESAEQTAKRLAQGKISNRRRLEQETPEEADARKKRHKLRTSARFAAETEEQKMIRLEKQRDSARRHYKEESEEKKKKRKEKQREKRMFNSALAKINMTEERREEIRKRDYFYRQANKHKWRWCNLPPEEVDRRKKLHEDWKANLTGEKKERHLASVRRALKKSQKKQYEKFKNDPVKWEEIKQKQRDRYALETPDQRAKRRYKDKVNMAKTKLRKKLHEEGVPQEEIDKQLKDLWERMWRAFYPDGIIPPPGKKGPPKKERKVEPPPMVVFPPGASAVPDNLCIKDPLMTEEDISIQVDAPAYSPGYFDTAPSPDPSPPPSPPMPAPLVTVKQEMVEGTYVQIPIYVKCMYCPQEFTSNEYVRSHIHACHPDKHWKCPKCRVVVLSSWELSQHYDTAHKPQPPPPPPPPKEKSKTAPSSKAAPVPKREAPWKFVCIRCPFSELRRFRTRENLFAHVKSQHPSSFWPCYGCHLLKYTEKALNLHRSLCQEAGPIKQEPL